MTYVFDTVIGSSRRALVLILVIVALTIVDSQFVNAFYGTNLGSHGNLHLIMFVLFAIIAAIISSVLLLFTKEHDAPGYN